MDNESWKRQLVGFFRGVFGNAQPGGYICIALLPTGKREMRQKFFSWPDQLEELAEHVVANHVEHNVYFCPQLLSEKKCRKEFILSCPVIWADLDTCSPDQMLVRPNIAIQSSYGRYQALWVLEQPLEGLIAEGISKRIAYHHAKEGADKSGWDLTQLLRVPGTFNYNHEPHLRVEILSFTQAAFREADFNRRYPAATDELDSFNLPLPASNKLPVIEDGLEFLESRRQTISPKALTLYAYTPEPNEDWSAVMWRLYLLLYEGGLDREQIYVLVQGAACNKFARDGRPNRDLWNDVCRAYLKYEKNVAKTTIIPELAHVDLLTPEEEEVVRGVETFVERYTKWASGLGDAAVQYHQAGAFVILSALLGGKVVLPTSFGNIAPNLWFMILADTTITRKSTAMDIATDLLIEIDSDAIMATDGSIEGLLQGLSGRPSRASVFLRDEFSGLLEAMTKKDYMAGMAETLTKLYDGKYSKRILRKETIEIKEPCLIVFAGGIKARIQQLLTFDHVSSGFMPRFVYITAVSDVTRVRPMGPPIVRDLSGRDALLSEMADMARHYNTPPTPTRGIQIRANHKFNAELTPEAWARFNKFESQMLEAGVSAERSELLTPVYDRLGKSTLKAAVLLAAADSRMDKVVVEEFHILLAISYAAKWREYAIEVINGVGKSSYERDIERILELIRKRPGISRSALMQNFHLTAIQANNLLGTIEQRGLVHTNIYGKGTTYSLIDYKGENDGPP